MKDLDKKIRKLKQRLYNALALKPVFNMTDGEISILFELINDDDIEIIFE